MLVFLLFVLISTSAVCAADLDDSNDTVASSGDADALQRHAKPVGAFDISENDLLSADDVDGTYTDLQNMIDNATGTLVLPYDFAYNPEVDGGKFSGGVLINKNLTVDGNGHAISGNDSVRIFKTYAYVTLKNITFKDGNATQGGALYPMGSLTVVNCTFVDNHASYGGAMYYGTAVDCTFLNNSAGYGGAMFYGSAMNCSFSFNSAPLGGAVYGSGSAVNCTFNYNNASSGGAIYGFRPSALNCTFNCNNASSGGAIFFNGSGNVMDCCFIDNVALEEGGAVCLYGNNGIINSCSFENNRAKLKGGAVYWYGVNGRVSNSNFTNNTAAKYSGGAIQWDTNSSNGAVNNCNFLNNSATQKGGTIYWCGVNGTISNSEFINSTSINGGAIFWDPDAVNGSVNNCCFVDNTGNDGGAVYWYGPNGRMSSCNFTGNKATNGGAVNWQRTYGVMDNCILINNTATDGGALYWEGTNGTAKNTVFTDNTATDGGAVYWYAYNGTVNSSNFTGNTAESNGGAVVITGEGAKIDNAKLINNAAGKSGGAVYVNANDTFISNSQLLANSAFDGTDNVALGLDGEGLLIDNLTCDEGKIISFVAEIKATCEGEYYQGGDPVVISIKTNAKKGNVSVTVNGKSYNGTVEDGAATVSIPDLAAGNYSVAVGYHDFDGDYGDASDNVTFTVNESKAKIINKDIAKDYNSNYKYKIRIIGVDGEPVKGLKIKISINGKAKTYKTDSNGYVTVKLDKTYTPGKYTVKLSYKGVTSKHVITVKQILKSKKVVNIKKNAKKALLKATLKSSKGKAIKGKKITFNVNGKTYNAKTNKKGIAEIALKKNVIGKFKVGKVYTVKITYLKDTIKTKLKVKK